MLIEKKQLIAIAKRAKILKAHSVYISNGLIIGCDSEFTYLKSLTLLENIDFSINYICRDMDTFIKSIEDDIAVTCVDIQSNYISSPYSILPINNIFHIDELIKMYNTITCACTQNKLLLENNNLREDPVFEELLQLKSGDGIGMYRLGDNFTMSIFNGLLPVNKKDKLSLKIYDINESSFLANFALVKDKVTTMNIYALFLYLK